MFVPENSQQATHDTSGHESRRLKIAAAIVFVLIAIVAGAALIGIYLSQPPPPPEVFTIVLKDPEAAKPARVKLKFNKMERIEYSMSPTVENSHDMIYMLKDYSRGLVAHKDFRQGLCLIGRLNDTEESAKQRAKAFKNKLMQVAATDHFLILNGSVHPEVLVFAAGWRLAHYCGSLAAHWLVRRMATDPLPDTNVVSFHETETENSKINPPDEEQADLAGEEEKMQILTNANPNDEHQPEQELPPEDPALIQEAETTALLEEKTSILAEKLDITPEEALHPASSDTGIDEPPSPNAEDAPPTDTLPKIPFLEEKLPTMFGHHPPPSPRTSESPETKAEEEEAAAEFGRSEEKNEEPVANRQEVEDKVDKGEEKTEEIKSTADEKSTVEKAPHVDDREKETEVEEKPSLLARDLLLVDEPRIVMQRKVRNRRASVSKLDDDDSAQMDYQMESKTLGTLSRRKRNACTIRCWYFIRKLKGYRRCVYRCF